MTASKQQLVHTNRQMFNNTVTGGRTTNGGNPNQQNFDVYSLTNSDSKPPGFDTTSDGSRDYLSKLAAGNRNATL